MLFSNWYFSMIFIIIATSIYQSIFLKRNGYKYKKKITLLQRLATWLVVLTPIANTFIGLMSTILLCLYVFNESLVIEAIEHGDNFEKIE